MSKNFFLLALPCLLAFVGCNANNDNGDINVDKQEIVFCAEETKTCPDGSTVSRVPPDCEFDSCLDNGIVSLMTESKIELSQLPQGECDKKSGTQTSCPVVGDIVAKITTNHGEIWVRLFTDETPKTTENFIGLSERGYYNGLIFHRVIPDFMIQGGDPTGTGMGGESIWGKKFVDELIPSLKNLRGALSMANAGPGTNGSQFFIVQKKGGTLWLDGHHTVFGQVFSGMENVDEIANVESGVADKPVDDVIMNTIDVFEIIKNK